MHLCARVSHAHHLWQRLFSKWACLNFRFLITGQKASKRLCIVCDLFYFEAFLSGIYQSGYHVHRQLWKFTSLVASWLIFSHIPLARCFEGNQTGPCSDSNVRSCLRHVWHLLSLTTYLFIISAYQSTGKLPCSRNLLSLNKLDVASVSVYWIQLTVQEHHSHLIYFFYSPVLLYWYIRFRSYLVTSIFSFSCPNILCSFIEPFYRIFWSKANWKVMMRMINLTRTDLSENWLGFQLCVVDFQSNIESFTDEI